MSALHIAYEKGWYRVYRTHNGLYREYVGPKFDTPKSAARYADLLEKTERVSPLRPTAA